MTTMTTMTSSTRGWAVVMAGAALMMVTGCRPSSNTPPVAEVASPRGMQAAASHDTASTTPTNIPMPSDAPTVEGTVTETMDASNYTYVKVKTASDELWAATSTFKIAVGEKVIVPLENPMRGFHSTNLNRDFPLIYFVGHIARPGEAAPAAPAASATAPNAMPGAPGATPADDAPQLIEKIAAAPGGVTVGDVVSKRKTFAGKTVTVRGKVMKFNPNILGVNWIHIQDGSGVVKDGSYDVLVTSSATVKVGDVVTVTGTVALDKDFTAGYRYDVLIEKATVAVK